MNLKMLSKNQSVLFYALSICFVACFVSLCFSLPRLHADEPVSGIAAPISKEDVARDDAGNDTDWQWETVETKGMPTARHEAAFVAHQGKLYLLGGRRINPVDVYDPKTNTWTAKSKTPLELHHFQAVAFGDAIYLVGAMTGRYPNEKPLEKVVVYYPKTDRFDFIHSIPKSRRRGGAGVTLHGDKLLIAGGITNGHVDGSQAWLDQYDPRTGDWLPLADAPDVRDHLQTAVIGDRLYFFAGRNTRQRTRETFNLTIERGNVYDIKNEQWVTTEKTIKIPTQRAGNMAFAWGDEIVIGGGESASQKKAHHEVEAYNIKTGTWRRWPDLQRGRHGSGFAVIGDFVYTAAGSGNRGGAPELATLERLRLPSLENDVATEK